jgi:hypothetical protein
MTGNRICSSIALDVLRTLLLRTTLFNLREFAVGLHRRNAHFHRLF